MITTVDTKREQLRHGYYQSGTGPEEILIVGSCRSVAYLDYLDRWNRGPNRFTIRFIDPFNWHWNERDEFIDFEAKINSLESDQRILSALSTTSIYIHEYYDSFGMFNSSRENPKNIYQFGLNPRLDICIPNFNDVNILGHDKATGEAALEKFYGICRQTDFPEFEDIFKHNWRKLRFFWTANHVSKHFTLLIFRILNETFLHLDISEEAWREMATEDLFANTPAPVTQQDRENHQLQW